MEEAGDPCIGSTLERYCGFLQNSMWKWEMQLRKSDAGILPLLQIAQPGDRQWGEMTLERVRLISCRTSQSTWKLLVCKGQQKMETVWLSVVRSWGMPLSRISAEAAIRLGHTAQPNEWCHVRPCSDMGRLGGAFLAKVASTLEIMPPEGVMVTRPGRRTTGGRIWRSEPETGVCWRDFFVTGGWIQTWKRLCG